MPAVSFNFAFAQTENKHSTTCKDQSESLCKLFTHVVYIYETQRVYLTPRRASACQGSVIVIAPLLFLER